MPFHGIGSATVVSAHGDAVCIHSKVRNTEAVSMRRNEAGSHAHTGGFKRNIAMYISTEQLMSFLKNRFLQWWRARRARRISLEYAQERVRRGATYLDDVDPGWHRRVDPTTLELSSGSSCVLGQLHGDFRMGLSRAHLINLSSAPRASLSPVSYGFQCVSDVDDMAQDRDYTYLNQAWHEAVRRRYADDVAAGVEPSDGGSGDREAMRPERSPAPPAMTAQ
jgi:hypothetical protein